MASTVAALIDSAPKKPRDIKFCERYLDHFDVDRAYKEAGFSVRGASVRKIARKKLQAFAEYLLPLQKKKTEAMAKVATVGAAEIIEALEAVAFPKIEEYLIKDSEPIKVKHQDGDKVVVEDLIVNGEKVYRTLYKPLHELTPKQLLAVEIFTSMSGHPVYKLPTPKVRHQYIESLGKQLGMFMDKLILQRQDIIHQHAHLHLGSVPTERLESAVRNLLPIVGPEFARQLGFTAEEYEEASEGVVVTQTTG